MPPMGGTQNTYLRAGARRVLWRAGVGAIFALVLLPMFVVVWLSFFRQGIPSFPPEGYSLRWYANALAQAQFVEGLATSIELALISAAIGTVLGTAAAYGLVRGDFPGRSALGMLLLGPLAVPGIVLGTGLYVVYVQADSLFDITITATLPGLIAAHVLLTIPWTVRLVGASLAGVGHEAEEAASNLGARPLTVFWRVTLPLMRPGVVAAALFGFIQSFENLELSVLLVGPGRTTLPVAMLNYLEFRVDPTLAAVATLQILVIGALMLLADRFVSLSKAFS
jgi:putative spermidine/putrescine transport system permease protein